MAESRYSIVKDLTDTKLQICDKIEALEKKLEQEEVNCKRTKDSAEETLKNLRTSTERQKASLAEQKKEIERALGAIENLSKGESKPNDTSDKPTA